MRWGNMGRSMLLQAWMVTRDPFNHGLLPISKLIFSDGTLTLAPLKNRLLHRPSPHRVDALQISPDNARLVHETLASLLQSDPDPAGADVHDLILFLYIQSYNRIRPRTHKDSTAVSDACPSTSAFDGYLSALSLLQPIGKWAVVVVMAGPQYHPRGF